MKEDPKTVAVPEMPDYQYPPEPVCLENAHRWKWMRTFYEREVSRPASADETPEQAAQRAATVRPTPEKLAYLERELITFPHFGMSTVSGHQQGTGKEDPRSFNPVAFDAREWVRFHKAIGAGTIVFVAKHHDGYALWPSRLNDYNIRSSPWRGGQGDMVREMADACREGGIKLGLYISLWDLHDPRINPRIGADRMTPEQRRTFQAYAEQQLLETLIPYGEIAELWFDGAGTTGAEDWNRLFEIIHVHQPKCIVAMCGFGNRWCGNESAIGDAVNWNVLPMLPELRRHHWVPFHFDQLISKRLSTLTDDLEALRGQELFFLPQECDTCVLTGGWHWDGVGEPRSLESLVNIYYDSIGSGGVLIISPAPDPSGAFPARQVERLLEWRRWLADSFRSNLLEGAKLTPAPREGAADPAGLLRAERDRPWIVTGPVGTASLEAAFPEPRTFNNLVLEEHLAIGQRISRFSLEAWRNGQWMPVTDGRTVGHKRVVSFADISAAKVRLRLEARAAPALRFAGLYKALPYGAAPAAAVRDEDFLPALPDRSGLRSGMAYSYYEDPANGYLPYQELFDLASRPDDRLAGTGFTENPLETISRLPEERKRSQHWAVRFDGYVRVPARAIYTFRAGANSGCRVYVDGQPLIRNDESGALAEGGKRVAAPVPLSPGLHRLTVLYYFGVVGEPRLYLVAEWPGSRGGAGFGWSAEQRLLGLLCCDA